ncbi:MAG: phage integrase N-terminal SAM-like domain-containing protein [Nitrococcus sp.]|nr:phage integrase N-terminal SAM-like domain-containing protein [Nitrococcus sp.]
MEVELFLAALEAQHDVAASTRNRALNAILFLYREALGD